MFKHRGKYFWLASGAAATALALLTFYLIGGGAGVSFENKPLETYWFRQVPLAAGITGMSGRLILPGQRYGNFAESPVATRKAIETMGTNCLPLLVEKLGRRDSSRYQTIRKWAFRLRIGVVLGRSADAERAQAVTALLWLAAQEPFPQWAIAEIQALSQSKDAGIATSANVVLARSGAQPATRTRKN